jgi:UDP-GlcNAc:undecaprenyl-phosphate GlcNAc-1-phosphate transferase
MISIFSLIVAFSVTVLSILMLKPLALRIGLVDTPGGRKKHQGQIPLIGGLAMFIGLCFAMLTLPISLSDYRSFIAAAGLLMTTGLLDDFHELSTRARFILQILVGLLMTAWGNNIIIHLGHLFYGGDITLGNWGLPFTVIAVVGVINAVNMTDGVDGLAGTLALIEMILLSYLALHAHAMIEGQILLLVIAILLAFLSFNMRFPGRSHALIFMGDAGSMVLGFILVWFAVKLTQQAIPAAQPVTMLWILALPLWDLSNVMVQRVMKLRSPFSPDRSHFHHLLLQYGFGSMQTSLIMCAMALVLGMTGIAAEHAGIKEGTRFFGFLLLFVVYVIATKKGWQKIKGQQ